jgi:hypothetical protein
MLVKVILKRMIEDEWVIKTSNYLEFCAMENCSQNRLILIMTSRQKELNSD